MMRRLICLFVSLFACLAAIAAPKAKQGGDILFINSYNADTYYAIEFTQDFIDAYTKVGGKSNLVIEAMNCNTLDQHKQWMPALQEILKKHEDARMVILYGTEAWACYLSLTDPKWRSVPVCLVASQKYGACMEFDDIPIVHRSIENTGQIVDFQDKMEGFNIKMCYYYDYAVIEDVQMIKRLDESINTIAVVGDNSFSGYSMLRYSVEMLKKNFPALNVVEIDGVRVDSEGALEMMKNLPKKTAIVYGVWRYDRNGSIALNLDRSIFGSRDDIPVLTLTGRGFGTWTIGGSNPHYDWYDGRMHPALLTYELLDQGMDIEPYFYKCPNFNQFDLEMISRFGYDPDNLPDSVMLLNNQMSFSKFFEMYKMQFILSISLIVLLIVALCFFIAYSLRINIMKKSLQASAQQLKLDKEMLEANEKDLILARDRAEASDRMKTHFIHNISHEVRTPLNAIQGFSQILLDPSLSLDEEAKKNLSQRIWTNVELITSIVDDILQYSDLESQENRVEKAPVNCKAMCESLEVVVNNHKRSNVAYSYESTLPDDFEVVTDEKLTKDVLVQLLKNACKFTESGSISLSTKVEDDKLLFVVKDTGPGIPASKADFVFERFKKLNEFSQGTGLGLSICKIISRELGGDVYIDTVYRNGAKFIFSMPLK